MSASAWAFWKPSSRASSSLAPDRTVVKDVCSSHRNRRRCEGMDSKMGPFMCISQQSTDATCNLASVSDKIHSKPCETHDVVVS